MDLHQDFWKWSLPERRAWFVREVMVRYVPQEVLPGDAPPQSKRSVAAHDHAAPDAEDQAEGEDGRCQHHDHGAGRQARHQRAAPGAVATK